MLDQFLVLKVYKNNDPLVFDQFYQVRDCNIRIIFNEFKIDLVISNHYEHFEIKKTGNL